MSKTARRVTVHSLKNQALIADKCSVAECFGDRLQGLIGRKTLEPGEGMLFPRCNSIHMWFMRFSIDVVFLRKASGSNGSPAWTVSSFREGLRPWSLLPVGDWKADDTLELPIGTIRRCQLAVGDELCIS